MQQQTFAEVTFEPYRTVTHRDQFLAEMNRVVPWKDLVAVIRPVYPKTEGPGRPPVGIERMLRLHCLQQWFNLSDPAVEEALYDSRAMRQFVGIDLGHEPVPDETTICKFRHLLEAHQLGEQLFARISTYLAAHGLKVSRGTIVDATIIAAPSSTKNRTKERDPEMHQTKKGNQWYFGMKAHIGVDSRTKLIHSVAATAAHVHDSQVVPKLLHGQEHNSGIAASLQRVEPSVRTSNRPRDEKAPRLKSSVSIGHNNSTLSSRLRFPRRPAQTQLVLVTTAVPTLCVARSPLACDISFTLSSSRPS